MSEELVLNVTEETFTSEVLESTLPVMVDFWAKWCGPCKSLSPFVYQMANDWAGKIKVVKVDVDSNSQLTKDLGIRGIPALFFYKDGKVVDTLVGFVALETLEKYIRSVLK